MKRTITPKDRVGFGATGIAFASSANCLESVGKHGQNNARTCVFQPKDVIISLRQHCLGYYFIYIKLKN